MSNGTNTDSGNEVSVEVEQGEIVGLLVPTAPANHPTFYMIVGLRSPNGGQIWLDNTQITDFPMYRSRARLGIGYLAQEASVFRKLSVEDNLMAVMELSDMTRQGRGRSVRSHSLRSSAWHAYARASVFNLSGGEPPPYGDRPRPGPQPNFILLERTLRRR